MEKIKCITFDKKAQDSIPDDIRLKMNIDRKKAESNMNKTWNKSNPTENGGYICRMNNAYIKMCYWNGTEWFDMWKTTLDGIVVEWMHIPYDELFIDENKLNIDKGVTIP
jgi:hypothetical protein